jgi:hypothetical protein
MGGEVQYIRESERSFFLIILELPQPRAAASREISWYAKFSADLTQLLGQLGDLSSPDKREPNLREAWKHQYDSDEAHQSCHGDSMILSV